VDRYTEIDFPWAERYARQVWELTMHDGVPQQSRNISVLIMMASICREKGLFQTGIQHLEDALELARYRGDPVFESAILNDLGFDYGRFASRQEEACNSLEESIPIRERAGLDQSAPLYNLGWLLTRKGKWKEAEERFQQPIVASKGSNQAIYRGWLGYLNELREEYAQAETELLYRIEVLNIYRHLQNLFGYTGVAMSYALSGDDKQSRQYLEQARRLFEEETRPRKKWWCLYEMAEVYRILHDHQMAETMCKQAVQWFLEQAEQAEDLLYLAGARFVMGKILVDSQSYQQALPYLEQAETTLEQCRHYMLGEVWFHIGRAYSNLGDDRAEAYVKRAHAEFQRLELHRKETEARELLESLKKYSVEL
jgi:tetratricopeptide (TPR) repeat protein